MLWTLLLICLPRIYLGYHYPSDVLAGGVLGVVLMPIVSGLFARMRWPDWVVEGSKTHSAAFYGVAFLVSFELVLLFANLRHFALDAMRLGHMLAA